MAVCDIKGGRDRTEVAFEGAQTVVSNHLTCDADVCSVSAVARRLAKSCSCSLVAFAVEIRERPERREETVEKERPVTTNGLQHQCYQKRPRTEASHKHLTQS